LANCQRVLPNADNHPTAPAQFAANRAISRSVLGDFLAPESRARFWCLEMSRATMPEAPVDENGDAKLGKCKIRAAWQRGVSAPTGNSVKSE